MLSRKKKMRVQRFKLLSEQIKVRVVGLAFSRPSRDFRDQGRFHVTNNSENFETEENGRATFWGNITENLRKANHSTENSGRRNQMERTFPEKKIQNLGNALFLKITDNAVPFSTDGFNFPKFKLEFFIEWKAP